MGLDFPGCDMRWHWNGDPGLFFRSTEKTMKDPTKLSNEIKLILSTMLLPKNLFDVLVESLGYVEAGKRSFKIVCICGSSRFVDVMAVEAWKLEKQGVMVIGPHLLPSWYDGIEEHHQAEKEGVAQILDTLHERKIDLADEILVVNYAGYIGERTKIEIAYANDRGKPIKYLQPI